MLHRSPRTALLSLLAAGALTVSGCGSGDAEESGAAGGSGGSDAAEETVEIEHEFGTAEITGTPERVVALGVTDIDPVLALGVVPVAAAGYSFFGDDPVGPWATDLADGQDVAYLESDSEPNIEEIVAMDPDLIVAISSGIDQTTYDLLEQVAPTLARPAGTAAYTASREEATTMVAQALGQEERGEELIAEADAAFDEAVEANPDFNGASGTVVLPYDGQYGAYTPGDARGALMEQLGFVLPEPLLARDNGDSFFIEVSRENLDLLDGDVLVALVDEAAADVVADDAVLQALDVTERGDLIVADGDLRAAMTYNTVLSAPFAVESLAPQLADALAS